MNTDVCTDETEGYAILFYGKNKTWCHLGPFISQSAYAQSLLLTMVTWAILTLKILLAWREPLGNAHHKCVSSVPLQSHILWGPRKMIARGNSSAAMPFTEGRSHNKERSQEINQTGVGPQNYQKEMVKLGIFLSPWMLLHGGLTNCDRPLGSRCHRLGGLLGLLSISWY